MFLKNHALRLNRVGFLRSLMTNEQPGKNLLMRATIGPTPLLLILFGGCFELPAPAKDSVGGDTGASGGECPPDSIPGPLGSVTILDFVVNGLRLGPSASSLCSFAGGYGARLSLSAEDELGLIVVQSEAQGAWGVPDPEVSVSVQWQDTSWAASDFFTGSVVISDGGGGDSGLGDSSGGSYVSFNGEATNADSAQLILDVSWGG